VNKKFKISHSAVEAEAVNKMMVSKKDLKLQQTSQKKNLKIVTMSQRKRLEATEVAVAEVTATRMIGKQTRIEAEAASVEEIVEEIMMIASKKKTTRTHGSGSSITKSDQPMIRLLCQ